MHEHQAHEAHGHHEAEDGRDGSPNDGGEQGVEEAGTARFSVSLPGQLLRDFDTMAGEKGYGNRSLAVADMIRAALVEHGPGRDDQEIAGTITLVYDHHKRNLQSSLTDLQHEHTGVIISTLHVHLDHDNCLEVLVVRGRAGEIKKMADALLAARGVQQGRFTIATISRSLAA